MKTFKKIEFNSSKLNHEEMKSIKAGYYGGYACGMNIMGNGYNCQSAASSCMKENGSMGSCTITITSGPFQYSCACE